MPTLVCEEDPGTKANARSTLGMAQLPFTVPRLHFGQSH